MKIFLLPDTSHRFTMGMLFHLVDEDGKRIENATFVDFHNEKKIDNVDYTYITIILPTDDLFFEEKTDNG